MPHKKTKHDYSTRLSRKAEELLKTKVQTKGSPLTEDEILTLIYELEAAWMDIDIQNEEIMRAEEEKTIRVDEEIFNHFLENSPVYIFFKDENIRSLNLSRNYETLLGKPLKDLLGKNMEELFPSDLAKEMVALDRKILKEGKKVIVEEEFNGHYYSTIKFPIYIEGEKPLLAGFTIDITENKKAQLALKKSEEKYRKLHQSLRDGFVYVSMEGKIIESNVAYQDLLGYSQAELEQLTYRDLTPEKWSEMENKIIADHILPKGFSPVYEKEYRKKDGTIFPVELRTFLITDDQNHPIGMWAIVRDITERKHAEEILRESEKRASAMLSAIPDMLFRVNRQGIFLDYKADRDDLYIQNWPTLIGKTYRGHTPPEFSDLMDLKTSIALETGELQTFEYQLDVPGKGIRFYEARLAPCAKDEVIALTRDITEHQQMESVLKESEAQLRELNNTKDKFFSIIAHDLKNPFTAIIGFSSLLLNQIRRKDYDGLDKFASNILQSSEKVMELLKNLQDWSRSQTGRMAFNPEPADLMIIVHDIKNLFDDSAQQKAVTIVSEISSPTLVFADKAMINTVLRNLISNAIKFTSPSGQITISAEEKQGYLWVSISDTGVGIPQDGIGKLFRIGHNYSTPGTNNEKGTGLGLILCKEFIDKHNGEIKVESELGKGSRFCFSIPINV